MLEKLLDADFDHQVVAKFFMRDVKLVTTKFLVAFSVLCVYGISFRSVVSGTFATGNVLRCRLCLQLRIN